MRVQTQATWGLPLFEDLAASGESRIFYLLGTKVTETGRTLDCRPQQLYSMQSSQVRELRGENGLRIRSTVQKILHFEPWHFVTVEKLFVKLVFTVKSTSQCKMTMRTYHQGAFWYCEGCPLSIIYTDTECV